MRNGTLADYFAQLERERGLPPGFLARTRAIESANGTRLKSPTGPEGPFQFTKATARAMGLPLQLRNDERASARAAADYADQNQSILKRALGREPTAAELYMGHQQGGGGAVALLTNPNAAAGTVTPANNIAVNAGNPNAPASSFIQKFRDRFNAAKPANLGEASAAPAAYGPPMPPAIATAIEPTRPASGMPAPVIGKGQGLLGMAMADEPMTRAKLMGFMGGGEMSAALKGAGMLAGSMSQQAPAAPMQQLSAEVNTPDLSMLELIKRKRGLV